MIIKIKLLIIILILYLYKDISLSHFIKIKTFTKKIMEYKYINKIIIKIFSKYIHCRGSISRIETFVNYLSIVNA